MADTNGTATLAKATPRADLGEKAPCRFLISGVRKAKSISSQLMEITLTLEAMDSPSVAELEAWLLAGHPVTLREAAHG